ncbi:hypothetical protein JCM11641_004925 [Rhodosporidiobolus odoratus]
MEQHLVSIPNIKLFHRVNGGDTLLFDGIVSLSIATLHQPSITPGAAGGAGRAPPTVPPRPLTQTTPLPPSYSSLNVASSSNPSTSTSTSPSPQQYLLLRLSTPESHEPVFEMPVSLADPANSIVASPPASYLLPNLTGVDPSSPKFLGRTKDSKVPLNEMENGQIKLTLPVGDGGLDPETRELFEASLYGLYRGQDSSGHLEQLDDPHEPPPTSQLYLVDERNGQVLGELAADGLVLEESGEVATGKMADVPGSTATGPGRVSLDGHEPVVIDSLAPSSAETALSPSITYSVKPVSAYYQPADNPQSSSIITAANFLSHGIVIGSELLAKQFESGAGKYVASRPATTTPMVFKSETKARVQKGNQMTQTATVYSGKAAKAVGNVASKIGDRIGKSAGIQSQAGGPAPKGWRGVLASSLTAVSTVADHLESGGKTLLDSGSKSASQVIHHKYGGEARGVADDVGGSVKHCALVYIDARGVGRKALLKSVGKSALRAKMADGSEVILSNSNGELHQIEASATSMGNNGTPLAIEGNASGSTLPYAAANGASGRKSPLLANGGGMTGGWGGKAKAA